MCVQQLMSSIGSNDNLVHGRQLLRTQQPDTIFLQREVIYLLGTLHKTCVTSCAPGPVFVFVSCPVSFYPWFKCIPCKLLLLFHIHFFPVSLYSSKISVAVFKSYLKIIFLSSRSFLRSRNVYTARDRL